jgi:hypothetical protein
MTSETVTQGDDEKAKDTSLPSLSYADRAELMRNKKRVIKLSDGRERHYTAPGTFDHKLIIKYAKEVYLQLKDLGQDRVTLRTWYYNLIDYEVLNLRVSEDPYKLLSKVFVNARRGKYGEEYRMPYSWFVDKRRTPPPERPWMTPQQYVDDLIERIKGSMEVFPHPMFFRQENNYPVILTEKDTITGPIQNLIKMIFGGKPGDENQIPVIDVGGFSSMSHKRTIYRQLKKQEKMGRTIRAYSIADWDPSGIYIDRDLQKVFSEWSLKDYEIKRIGVTGEQVKKLKLYKATDPKTMAKLRRDSRHKEFMRLNDRKLFQTEADTLLKAAGLRELKRIIEEDIVKKYWKKKTWEKYADEFTFKKVQKRLVQGIGEITTEVLGDSEIEDAINEALSDLQDEEDELREIEGDDFYDKHGDPIDEEDSDYQVAEDEEEDTIELE